MAVDFTYIDTRDGLHRAYEEWKKSNVLGIDVECENNLHHYGAYISLIQISSKTKNWIVDVLRLKNIEPLLRIFRNHQIQKIFHDVDFDFRIIYNQFNCGVKNVFDTQLAATFLGKDELGLGSLLEEYFRIKKEKKFQKADWTKRPLTNEMLAYASKDTQYLIKLRDILKKELKERLPWVEEELKNLEKKDWTYKECNYLDLKGVKDLTEREKLILKHLFRTRDKMAKKVNRPVHFIMGTKMMMKFVQNPPSSVKAWQQIKGTHPIIRNKAHHFFEAVQKGRQEKIVQTHVKLKKLKPEQRTHLDTLTNLRDVIAEKVGLKKHLIMNKDQMIDIVISGNYNSLRRWQKKLLSIR